MINIKVELIENIIQELQPLIIKHWKEIARHKELIELNPDFDRYIAMNRAGLLQIITVRNDGNLIGYNAIIIAPHLHYKDHLMAVNDIIYIDSAYRKSLSRGRVAIKLLKFTEDLLKEMGVTKIFISMKIKHDFGNLLEKIGYTAIENTYEKLLIGG